jgi:hypothetical protein
MSALRVRKFIRYTHHWHFVSFFNLAKSAENESICIPSQKNQDKHFFAAINGMVSYEANPLRIMWRIKEKYIICQLKQSVSFPFFTNSEAIQ